MLNVENLSFSYGRKQIFSNLSFSAGDGEAFVVAGPNGSGKSTLLSILSGVLKPSSGRLLISGKTAYVPQGIALFDDMTVGANIDFFASLSKTKVPKELPLGIGELLSSPVSKLSVGTQKRVSIACALIGNPSVLIMDEPCAGLDLCYREELISLIKELKNSGCTVIYAGHEPAEFSSFYDKLLFLGNKTPAVYTEKFISGCGGVYNFLLNAEKELNIR